MRADRPTRSQWFIALLHLLLALSYGVFNPPWEAHDETGHYAYVDHVARHGSLPDVYSAQKALFDQSHQPPLYYLLTAGLTSWLDRDKSPSPQLNHFALDGTNRRGVRIVLRQPGESFPWQGALLGLHLARVVSALLTTGAVVLIAYTLNCAFGRGSVAALLGSGVAAFNPQFLFMGAMVNNDALVSFAGALVAWRSMRVLRAERHRERQAAALGLAAGLGLLAKNSAVALAVFGVLSLLLIGRWQRWGLGALVRRLAVMIGAGALVAGPLYAYNWLRYGRLILDRDPGNPLLQTPTSVIAEGVWVSLRDAWLPQVFLNTFRTFWGKFGWGNVGMPEPAYLAYGLLTLIGLLGLVLSLRRLDSGFRRAVLLLALLGAAMVALPLYRALYFQSPALMPGRYLMPALASYAGLLGLGWSAWLTQRRSVVAVLALMMTWASVVMPVFVWPRYAPTYVAWPADAPALLTFEDRVQVMQAELQDALLPDREGMRPYARVRVVWRALRPAPLRVAFAVSVLGREREVLGSLQAYPNLGNYPADNWQPGQAFEDHYDILLEKPCMTLPTLARLHIAVFEFDWDDQQRVVRLTREWSATDSAGRTVQPVVGRFRIGRLPTMGVHWQPPLADFDGIWLREVHYPESARAGQPITVSLTYEMIRPNGKDGTAFVHALDAHGRLVAQDDHPPNRGEYPTDFWQSGECARETFSLPLPADVRGPVQLVTGFYDAQGSRFLTNAPNNAYLLGVVKVDAP